MARSVTVLRGVIAGALVSAGVCQCALYLTAQERTIHDEAAVYAERYRRQAEQLNERANATRRAGLATRGTGRPSAP